MLVASMEADMAAAIGQCQRYIRQFGDIDLLKRLRRDPGIVARVDKQCRRGDIDEYVRSGALVVIVSRIVETVAWRDEPVVESVDRTCVSNSRAQLRSAQRCLPTPLPTSV